MRTIFFYTDRGSPCWTADRRREQSGGSVDSRRHARRIAAKSDQPLTGQQRGYEIESFACSLIAPSSAGFALVSRARLAWGDWVGPPPAHNLAPAGQRPAAATPPLRRCGTHCNLLPSGNTASSPPNDESEFCVMPFIETMPGFFWKLLLGHFRISNTLFHCSIVRYLGRVNIPHPLLASVALWLDASTCKPLESVTVFAWQANAKRQIYTASRCRPPTIL